MWFLWVYFVFRILSLIYFVGLDNLGFVQNHQFLIVGW